MATYSSLASRVQIGNWETSSGAIPWLALSKAPHGRDLEEARPQPKAGSAVFAPFLVDTCLVYSQFSCPENYVFKDFQAIALY